MPPQKQKNRQAAGTRILYLRQEVLKISQAELAKRAGVSEGTIASAEDDGLIQPVKLSKIANDGFGLQDVNQLDKARQTEWIPQEQLGKLVRASATRKLDSTVAHQTSMQPVMGIAEAGITVFYPSRDYYSRFRSGAATIDRYVARAEHSLVMVSINLMTGLPYHDLCACMKKMLTKKGDKFSATISLLDPRCSELMTVVAPILNTEASDLASSIHGSLKNLVTFKDALPKPIRKRFDVRVHRCFPSGSAIMLDDEHENGRIQIETKPYKAGLQKSFAFEVARTGEDGLFDVLCEAYRRLLADGESWPVTAGRP